MVFTFLIGIITYFVFLFLQIDKLSYSRRYEVKQLCIELVYRSTIIHDPYT